MPRSDAYYPIRQLLPAPTAPALAFVAPDTTSSRAGRLFPVVALALLDHADPSRGALIVPVILDHDGQFLPVVGDLARQFIPCSPRAFAEEYLDDLRAAHQRMQDPLPKAAKA